MNDQVTRSDPRVVASEEHHLFTPRVDILETDEELLLHVDVPGVAPEDVDIRYEDRELVITAKVAPRHAEVKALRSEYAVGDFYRAFTIGETFDPEKISADLNLGVLVVRLPKCEAVKPRRIEVRSG